MNVTITLTDGNSFTVPLGYRKWQSTVTDVRPPYSVGARGRFTGIEPEFVVAGSYAWQSRSTLVLKLQYANWVTAVELHISFGNNATVNVSAQENYSSEPITIDAAIM